MASSYIFTTISWPHHPRRIIPKAMPVFVHESRFFKWRRNLHRLVLRLLLLKHEPITNTRLGGKEMQEQSKETRECPYCKEEIKSDAIKCKHCGSSVAPENPPHGGTCPYCKEQIHPEAIKCKHCGSVLEGGLPSKQGCRCPKSRPSPFGLTLRQRAVANTQDCPTDCLMEWFDCLRNASPLLPREFVELLCDREFWRCTQGCFDRPIRPGFGWGDDVII